MPQIAAIKQNTSEWFWKSREGRKKNKTSAFAFRAGFVQCVACACVRVCFCYLEMSGSLHMAYLDTTCLWHSNYDRLAGWCVCVCLLFGCLIRERVCECVCVCAAVTWQLKEEKKEQKKRTEANRPRTKRLERRDQWLKTGWCHFVKSHLLLGETKKRNNICRLDIEKHTNVALWTVVACLGNKSKAVSSFARQLEGQVSQICSSVFLLIFNKKRFQLVLGFHYQSASF